MPAIKAWFDQVGRQSSTPITIGEKELRNVSYPVLGDATGCTVGKKPPDWRAHSPA